MKLSAQSIELETPDATGVRLNGYRVLTTVDAVATSLNGSFLDNLASINFQTSDNSLTFTNKAGQWFKVAVIDSQI